MATIEQQQPTETPEKHYLKTADEYLESLQDGREVYYKGERVEDVTDPFRDGRRHPRDRRPLRPAVRRAEAQQRR